ncbi:40S ribosomal protein S2 [Microtus ochrogaster]|uniref:Small ribosomal subunit protein uS5 n=1 Tax=Microtus ochrogaster TaxID=79684 RepID=A0A8J6KPL9_MICOH|nr:40S ribosomal protein S2 [Microtus ochrogaster]
MSEEIVYANLKFQDSDKKENLQTSDKCGGKEHKCKPCLKGSQWFEDSCYSKLGMSETWQVSEMLCSSRNGSLLKIKNRNVLEFIKSKKLKGYWLGLMPRTEKPPYEELNENMFLSAGGTGVVSAPVPKKLLLLAGTDDCYTSAMDYTATLGNFAKAKFDAISKTYSYLTPDLWKETVFTKSPNQEFTDHLVKTHIRVSVQKTQAPAVTKT